MRSLAIEIGAGPDDPGGAGPVNADGTFTYVPAPEPDPSVTGPTYEELGLASVRPSEVRDTVARMNPTFPGVCPGAGYTFAAPPSETAHRLAALEAGDVLVFYTALTYSGDGLPDLEEIDPGTSRYLIGQFSLASDPIVIEGEWSIPRTLWEAFDANAIRRRESVDARVLVRGDPVESGLYRRVLPVDRLPVSLDDSPEGWDEGRPVELDEPTTQSLLRATTGGRRRVVSP